MWSDQLTFEEAEFTKSRISLLREVSWVARLVDSVDRRGGVKSENMPLLFEVRFASELYRASVDANYERKAGVGESTIDFHIGGELEWLIELVSIRETDAVKRAVREKDGLYESLLLTNNSEDPFQSPEAEMIKVAEKISEKVFDRKRGKPTKFPTPISNGPIHVIIADMRGFLGRGSLGDSRRDFRPEYQQIAFGWRGLGRQRIEEQPWLLRWWNGEPIKGLFEESNPSKAARLIRERIHLIGFVLERHYREGEISEVAYFVPNLKLFSSDVTQARRIFDSFPLRNVQ